MAIELTYGEVSLHEQGDLDRAILMTLAQKSDYVVQLTYPDGRTEDVTALTAPTGNTLYCRLFDEQTGGAVGPVFAVDADEIMAIKVY